MILVIRNIYDRVAYHKAELRLATEMTARQKDDEINRFTKHEVKNSMMTIQGKLNELIRDHKNQFNGSDTYGLGLLDRFDGIQCDLNEAIDNVNAEAMAKELSNGSYMERRERFDIALGLSKIFAQPGVKVSGLEDVTIQIDPELLKHVYKNAVTNAMKYGKEGATINVELSIDEDEMLSVRVINEGGDGHEALLELEDPSIVFARGVRLHRRLCAGEPRNNFKGIRSAGDGGWIIQKCAEAMKGTASIAFYEHSTCFTLKVPVGKPERQSDRDSRTDTSWSLPASITVVLIDDCRIQRIIVKKKFENVGVTHNSRLILRGTTEEIMNHVEFCVDLIQGDGDPTKRYLLLFDEILSTNGDLYSGSIMGQQILNRLSPQDNSRCLALVRSASDNASDIELYAERCHGCMQKKLNITSRETQLELGPIIEKRFGSNI